jgi:hypothetical protein
MGSCFLRTPEGEIAFRRVQLELRRVEPEPPGGGAGRIGLQLVGGLAQYPNGLRTPLHAGEGG